MAASATGIVAVAQPEDHVVKLFLPDGTARSVGREGEGPGDFRTPINVGWDLDTLWVIDGVLQRVSVFQSDGELIRTTAVPDADALRRSMQGRSSVAFRPALVGVGPAHMGVLSLITAPSEERDPLGSPGRAAGPALYGVNLQSGDGLISLGRQPRSESIQCRVRVDNSSSSFGFRLPWCSEGELALDPTGAWLATATPERTSVASDFIVHVELRSRRGVVRYAVDLPVGSAAIPSAEVDRMRAAITGRRTVPPSLRQAIRDTEFPTHFPPVDGLLVSELGDVWLRRPVDSAGSEWIVLGPDGTRRATVRFPAGVEPRFIGTDSVWGTSRSELDELSLVEFEVRLGR